MDNPLTGKVVEFRFTRNGYVAIRVNGLDVGSYPMPEQFDLVDAASLFTTLFTIAGFDLKDFANYKKEKQ